MGGIDQVNDDGVLLQRCVPTLTGCGRWKVEQSNLLQEISSYESWNGIMLCCVVNCFSSGTTDGKDRKDEPQHQKQHQPSKI
ncbi:hypothetical protein LB505_011012 [Fusarium chuoi]|nr:hypothetical protein LB505_011012 [Fusarium chuoi]